MPPTRKKPDVVAILVAHNTLQASLLPKQPVPTAGACFFALDSRAPATGDSISQTFPNFDLHRACAAGNLGLVQYAISQGQPVNSVLAGVLPLHAAASGGNEQVVKTLILAGADVNAPRLSSKIGPPQNVGGIATVVGPSHKGRLGSANSASGQSATYRPGSSSSGRSVPSVSTPTMGNRGSTPLHFAAAMGHPNIVKMLLDYGADPNARDFHKIRPIDAARTAGQSKIVRLLEEFEAHRNVHASASPWYPVMVSDFASNVFGSTSSLPGESVPAHPTSSTSSLGRYPAPQRRPSLPSIYESPPATAIHTVKAGAPHQQPVRRPRSAGATGTHSSSDTSTNAPLSSRIGRIFKKTSTRPSTALAAFQSPTPMLAQANNERPQTTHHVQTIPLHTKAIIGKTIERSLQSQHLPVLHRSHTPLPHVSTEDISAPMAHVMAPSRSDLVYVRPDMNKSTAPEPRAEDVDFYQLHGGLSAVELHYATTRGMDPFRPIRTAPPTQTVFAFEPVDNGRDPQMPKDLAGLPAPARHRLGLAGFPDRVQTQTPGTSNTTAGSGSSSMVTSDAVKELGERQPRQARRSSHLGLPSLIRTPHTAPPPVPNRERGASISSVETESSGAVQTPNSAAIGSSSTNPETIPAERNLSTPDEMRKGDTSGKPVSPTSSHEHSPSRGGRSMHKGSHSSLSKSMTATPASTPNAMRRSRPTRNSSPGGRGLRASEGVPPVPPVDTTWVASRAQAKELVEAHRRAIESEHEERVKRRHGTNGSTGHPFGSLGKTMQSPIVLHEQHQRSNESPLQKPEEGSEEEVLSGAALRERLAALGTTVQLERRFARGEKQGKSWNRSIDATGRGECSIEDSRAEMLDKYFDPEGEEKASHKMAAPARKDVFGRPITPKEKGRPTTPKDMQTAAASKSPLPSRALEAPRENRILPPPDKSVRLAGLSPAGPAHMPHRTRSDYTLPNVNREEVPGRDRAWTTADIRTPIGPVSVRPALSPTIEIVHTSPTPTDGRSPVRQNMGQEDRSYVRDAIYVEDEHASVMMRQQQSSGKSKRSNRPSTAPLSSSVPFERPERPRKNTRDASASPRLYGSSLPGVPEVHLPGIDPVAASHLQQTIQTNVSPLDSPTSSVEIDMGEPLTRITTEPLEFTPSAVDLHNLHFTRSGELEDLSYMPQAARIDNSGTYGFNGAQGMSADKSWRVLGLHARSPPSDTMKSSPPKAKKIAGFFSRKNR